MGQISQQLFQWYSSISKMLVWLNIIPIKLNGKLIITKNPITTIKSIKLLLVYIIQPLSQKSWYTYCIKYIRKCIGLRLTFFSFLLSMCLYIFFFYFFLFPTFSPTSYLSPFSIPSNSNVGFFLFLLDRRSNWFWFRRARDWTDTILLS